MSSYTNYEAQVQKRRQEAYDCRKMGYITLGIGATMVGVSALLSSVFHVPMDNPAYPWLIVPGIGFAIFGAFAAAIGAAEGY